MSLKRVMAVALCLATVFLASCSLGTKGVYYDLPNFDDPVPPEQQKTPSPNGAEQCTLYYDNSQSMMGFVTENSDFVRAVDSIYDIMSTWKAHGFYFLDTTANGLGWKRWVPRTDTETFKSAFKDTRPNKSGFYTFDKGSFPTGTGPLQLLFPEPNIQGKSEAEQKTILAAFAEAEKQKFSNVNIIVTDMAEQNMQTAWLARKLKAVVQTFEDHSVVIFALRSNFKGNASVPNNGTVTADQPGTTRMTTQYIDNKQLPFYIILVGPTLDVLKCASNMRGDFTTNLRGSFEYAEFLSNGGLQAVDGSDIVLGSSLGERDKSDNAYLGSFYTIDNSLETINLTQKRRVDLFPNATNAPDDPNHPINTAQSSTESITYISRYFAYSPFNSKNDYVCLNIYIPLPDLRGSSPKKLTYTSAAETTSATEDIVRCYIPAEKVIMKVGALPGETDNETTVEEATTVPGDAANKGLWKTIPEEDRGQYLFCGTSIIPSGQELTRIDPEKATGNVDKQKNPVWYTVTARNGMLRIQIKLTNMKELARQAPGGLVSIYFPITAKKQMDSDTPAWVKNYNYNAATSTDPEDVFLKTEGLDGFFNVLGGRYGSAGEQQEWNQTIMDLAIHIQLSK